MRRHLNVIGAERIKGAVAADPNCDAAVRDDCLGAVGSPPGCFRGSRRSELGNALDLARVKEGEGAQKRDAYRLSFFAISRALPRVGQLDWFESNFLCRLAVSRRQGREREALGWRQACRVLQCPGEKLVRRPSEDVAVTDL
jgi:hypothetical protein